MILFGAIGMARRRCAAARRIVALQSVAPRLTERLAQAYARVFSGDALDASNP